ncbi:MAG: hypothetical protein AVDCRST_MAG45-1515, partial [uncultured Solirubrobacterales bacterium]
GRSRPDRGVAQVRLSGRALPLPAVHRPQRSARSAPRRRRSARRSRPEDGCPRPGVRRRTGRRWPQSPPRGGGGQGPQAGSRLRRALGRPARARGVERRADRRLVRLGLPRAHLSLRARTRDRGSRVHQRNLRQRPAAHASPRARGRRHRAHRRHRAAVPGV